ncbi:hypothetical protein C7387_4336 [Yokenella regensburgei]|uniref:DUF2740 domain-containing protein n=1 Tax=Yokenella regensburgei TaxID=158877 RepID=A0ABX9RTI1_9ENTR|nr:hypothetical protein [Yokenella regensburgei]RKR53196.1 hypothetical protein C7387_4336 [Yokenella regensburgei]VFS16099.1 Uncharacterised protein [Yokenella regensburgei]
MNTQKEHKAIIRSRFIKSINPKIGEKLRAILEEIKRKEADRG